MIKSKKRMWLLIILIIIIILLFAVYYFLFRPVIITYSESDSKLDNPERGFYIQISSSEKERLEMLGQDNVRLTLLAFSTRRFPDTELDERKLNDLKECLIEAKKNHIKIIFRAAYGFNGECNEPEEIQLIGIHIQQIAEILNQYKEQVYCVQAGLLGSYGEWHNGKYLDREDEASSRENRLFVLRQWEQYLDEEINVAVRRPRFIREAEDAGILVGRLSFHNDGLLGSDSDLGTYDDIDYNREAETDWMQTHLKMHQNGGEMPFLCEWSHSKIANQEFQKMHISYLNRMYNTEVIDQWKQEELYQQNAKEYIENHLGYRLFLSQIEIYPMNVTKKIKLNFTINNSGYSVLPKGYQLYFVLEQNGQSIYHEIEGEELLYRICNGEAITINANAIVPKDMLEDKNAEIRMGLKIARSSSEPSQKECIELANDKFSYEDGVNYILSYK